MPTSAVSDDVAATSLLDSLSLLPPGAFSPPSDVAAASCRRLLLPPGSPACRDLHDRSTRLLRGLVSSGHALRSRRAGRDVFGWRPARAPARPPSP